MKICVDSNYFIALNNPLDTNYVKADIISHKVIEKNPFFVISSFTFLETTTVLSQRASRQIAVETGNDLLHNKHVEIIHITDGLQQKSWQIFQAVNKKNLSFVDCSILAVMQYEDIDTLLTFDQKDFSPLQKRYGFHLFPLE